jgi:c-di-GMP-binding flagellar brake protein YcgR
MPDNQEVLREAIERNTPVSIAVPSAGLMRQYRSRFVRAAGDTILLESVLEQSAAIDQLAKEGRPVTVMFRVDTQRVEFSAPVLERVRGIQLNADTLIEAIRLAWPTQIKAVQRRSDYRATVTAESGLSLKCWRVGEQYDLAAAPPAATLLTIDVRDLSAGGFGGIWKRRRDDPLTLADDQRFRVEVESPTGTAVFDARLRFLERLGTGDTQRIGVQFTLSPTNLQDRQKGTLLAKLITELQRQELRRKKQAR